MTRETSSRLSRRALLAGLGFGVAAAGAFAAPALHLSWTRKPAAKGNWWDRQFTSLAHAGMDEWRRRIGAEFALAGGAVAKLAEVTPLRSPGTRPAGLRDQAFAIVLEASGGALPAGDRIIDVSHAEAGGMKIYFSACTDKCGGQRLQAVFNQLMPPPLRAAARLGVSYRPATDEDLDFVSAVYASTRTEEVAASGWPIEVQVQFLAHQADAQHRHYRAHYPNAEWLVVERDGKAIGRLYLEEWPSQIRLIDISLLPEGRGGGVGGAILEDLKEAARAIGKALSIHVERNNPAMRLYLRLGFAKVDDHGVYDLMEWRPGPSTGAAKE